MTQPPPDAPSSHGHTGRYLWASVWPMLVLATVGFGLDRAIAAAALPALPVSQIVCNIVLAAGLYLIVGVAGELSLAQVALLATVLLIPTQPAAEMVHDSAIALLLLLMLFGLLIGLRAIPSRSLAGALLLIVALWPALDLIVAKSNIVSSSYLPWSRLFAALPAWLDHSQGWLNRIEFLRTATPATTLVLPLAIAGLWGALLALSTGYVVTRLPSAATPVVTLLLMATVAWFGETRVDQPMHASPLVTAPSGLWGYAAILAIFIAWRLGTGVAGQRMQLYRTAPDVAQTVGISLSRNRLTMFAAGSLMAVMAGVLIRATANPQAPPPANIVEHSLGIVAMVLLIQPGKLWSAIAGAIVIALLNHFAPWPAATMGAVYAGLILVAIVVRHRIAPAEGKPA